jgi:hypothetical protein
VNSTDRIIYEVLKVGVVLLPMSLGAFMFFSACIGYGKPPVKRHVRFVVGCLGLLLLALSVRHATLSK